MVAKVGFSENLDAPSSHEQLPGLHVRFWAEEQSA